jgi:hypothetical protein
MLSLLLGSLEHFLFYLTFKFDSFRNYFSILFLAFIDSFHLECISFSSDPCSFSFGIINNLSFNEICLGKDLIILNVSLRVDLVRQGHSFFFHLSLKTLIVSLHFFNFLGLSYLIQLSSLNFILSFLKTHLSE